MSPNWKCSAWIHTSSQKHFHPNDAKRERTRSTPNASFSGTNDWMNLTAQSASTWPIQASGENAPTTHNTSCSCGCWLINTVKKEALKCSAKKKWKDLTWSLWHINFCTLCNGAGLLAASQDTCDQLFYGAVVMNFVSFVNKRYTF